MRAGRATIAPVMRAGAVSLFLVGGCNSIFGLNSATAFDAADAYIDSTPGREDLVVAPLLFDPKTELGLTDASQLRLGEQDDVKYGPLPAVTADSWPDLIASNEVNGAFSVPHALTDNLYRITFTPPDGIPVEAQGRFRTGTKLVTYLAYGDNFSATAPPADATIDPLAPQGSAPADNYPNARWYVFGSTWAWHFFAGTPSGINSAALYTLDPSAATRPFTVSYGKLFTPKAGDVFVGFTTTDPGSHDPAKDFYWTNSVTAFGNGGQQIPTTQGAPIKTTPTVIGTIDTMVNTQGVDNALSQHGGRIASTYEYSIGVTPSKLLPSFLSAGFFPASTPSFASTFEMNGEGGLSIPMFATMATGGGRPLSYYNIFDGTIAPAFQRAAYGRIAEHRTANNIVLDEGVQQIAIATPTTGTTANAVLTLPAGTLANSMTLSGAPIWTSNAQGDVVPVPKSAVMEFIYGDGGAADDCMLTVYELTTTNPAVLKPIQRYLHATTDGHSIFIDGTKLDTAKQYIIGMKCHDGYADDLSTHDWTKLVYPFTEGTTYSYAFKVM